MEDSGVPGMVPVAPDQYAQEQEIRKDRTAQNGGIIDSTMRAFRSGDNYAYSIYKGVQRAKDYAPVEAYDPTTDMLVHKDEIGPHTKQFLYAGSHDEFMATLNELKANQTDQDILQRRGGVGTFVARGLAGLVDIDTPFALVTGGLGAGEKAAAWTIRASRAALAGGASQAAMATVANEFDPSSDWLNIPMTGLAGMAFGVAGASFARGASKEAEHLANESIQATKKEFADTIDEGTPLANRDIRTESFHADADPYGSVQADRDVLLAKEAEETAAKEAGTSEPQAFSIDDVEPTIPDEANGLTGRGASVGASQLNPTGSISNISDARSLKMVQDAQTWARQSGVDKDYFDDNGNLAFKGAAGNTAANGARRFHDAVTAIGIGSDFDRWFKSGSAVAKKVAYDLMENPSGIVRNNRSAAMIRDFYQKQMLGTFMPVWDDSFKQWARSKGISHWDRIMSPKVKEQFNRELAWELQGRIHDPAGTVRNVHPAIKEAADAHDKKSALEVDVAKGRPGEHSIKGWENIRAYSGYMQQKWPGTKMARLIQNAAFGSNTEKQIRNAVAEAYVSKHGIPMSDAKIWADAVVKRALAGDREADTNLIGILQQDGREMLEDTLRRNGLSEPQINKLIDRLVGAQAERGQMGTTKGRVDIDMRFTASNGITIMDLMDTDLARMAAKRARGISGQAALARKGIRSLADQQAIIAAIKHEQQARGPSPKTGNMVADFVDADKHLSDEELHDMFGNFGSGPVSGGVGPGYSRMIKLTNLALLNQLGLTQIAETGAQIASVGWKRWMEHAGEAYGAALGKADSPLVQELKHMSILVPEERLFRDDLPIEMDKVGTARSEFFQKVDHLLNTGQRLQGYMSGFNAVRNFQQRVAVTSGADKIMRNMKGLANDLSDLRAADLGLDPATFARIKGYVDNGTVEFRDGSLYKLNMDKWNYQDAFDFSLSLNRHMHQAVQRAMIGESNRWFHKDGAASLFFHLKSFPMLAMHKQMYRNARIADIESMYAFLAGLATAGSAYTAKQVINGSDYNLTPDRIAKGAFGLSNMTGWLPMWTDPLAAMLGMDDMRFNTYAQGIDSNVMSAPAAYTVGNRMLNIPGAIKDIATGNMTNSDVRALQTIPIMGNAYGFTYIFNALKH